MKLPAGRAIVANAGKAHDAGQQRVAVDGDRNSVGKQFWRITGYNNSRQISDEKILWSAADVSVVVAILRERLARQMTARDLEAARSGGDAVFAPIQDADPERRLRISVGVNPVFVATLWRSEETP